MSVREEDRQKNSCPSRGLGVAAAAIGVGVGAALYYFFSKRQENPNSEGSTSDWRCEQPQTFHLTALDDSYTTISEHETSDTSIHDTSSSSNLSWSENTVTTDESNTDTSDEESESGDSDSSSETGSDSYVTDSYVTDSYVTDSNVTNDLFSHDSTLGMSLTAASDSEVTEWDVTTSSLGVPEERSRSPLVMLFGRIGTFVSPRRRSRERSWTLEECSICFDVMLRNQEVTSLPCAHNFHTDCIMPWLQEKQTCPNCRKAAE